MRREYKTGSKYALWRWKDMMWCGELYLRRLILVQCPLFSIFIHWFHTPDKQRHLHDHPVSFISIILSGFYIEETFDGRKHRRINFSYINCYKVHKISKIDPVDKTVTLCIAGPRVREWGFYTEDGWIHYKKYQKLYGGSTS